MSASIAAICYHYKGASELISERTNIILWALSKLENLVDEVDFTVPMISYNLIILDRKDFRWKFNIEQYDAVIEQLPGEINVLDPDVSTALSNILIV